MANRWLKYCFGYSRSPGVMAAASKRTQPFTARFFETPIERRDTGQTQGGWPGLEQPGCPLGSSDFLLLRGTPWPWTWPSCVSSHCQILEITAAFCMYRKPFKSCYLSSLSFLCRDINTRHSWFLRHTASASAHPRWGRIKATFRCLFSISFSISPSFKKACSPVITCSVQRSD